MSGWRGIWTVAALGAWTACETDPAPVGLVVDLYAPAGEDPFAGVSHLTFLALAEGKEVERTTVSATAGQAEVPGIPFGEDRQLVVEGWADPSGLTVLSRGRSARVDVYDKTVSQTLSVMLAPVNRFSPLTDATVHTAQVLGQGRIGHTVTATVLGEIVIAGGGSYSGTSGKPWWEADGADTLEKSIEVIAAQSWTRRTHAQSMFFDRMWHTATALNTGQVLIAGGYSTIGSENPGKAEDPVSCGSDAECTGIEPGFYCNPGKLCKRLRQALKRVEVYYPGEAGDVQVLEKEMAVARAGHTATLVDDASFTILFVGGDEAGTYELWNPLTGSPAGAQPLPDQQKRRHHRMSIFYLPGYPQPWVLLTGGEDGQTVHKSSLVYNVANDELITVDDMSVGRAQHGSDLVQARYYVYLAGGFTSLDRSAATQSVDVYDFQDVKKIQMRKNQLALTVPRAAFASTSMPQNRVLYAGGLGNTAATLDTVDLIHEYLNPSTNVYNIEVAKAGVVPALSERRFGTAAVLLDTGLALLIGGAAGTGVPYAMPVSLDAYNPQ